MANNKERTMRGVLVMTWVGWLAASTCLAEAPAETGRLTGTVLAQNGSAAAGAIVWSAMFEKRPLLRTETIADAEGKFALDLQPGNWSVWARLGTQGGEGPTGWNRLAIAAGQQPEPITIQLEQRGTFRGRLLEAETRKPIAGGQLFLDNAVTLQADESGRFEIGGLERANHEMVVVAPGRLRMCVCFDTTARPDTELEVPVPIGGKILGSVTDTDGRPIPGASVGRLASRNILANNGVFMPCDDQGRFEYDDAVPIGQPTHLDASAPGYVDERRDGLVVVPGKPLEVSFKLTPRPPEDPARLGPVGERRRVVSGVVRGPDDQPAPGVLVRWGPEAVTGRIETRTDITGAYRMVVPDEEKLLAVLPRDLAPDFTFVMAGGDQVYNVYLHEGNVFRGQVVDDSRKPVEAVLVVAVLSEIQGRPTSPYWVSESRTFTDADGRFVLKGVPRGVKFDFLRKEMTEVRSKDLDPDDNTIVMHHGGAVVGQVFGPSGQPVRDFRVRVELPRESLPDDKRTRFAGLRGSTGVRFTSPDGTFVVTGIGADSDYRVTVIADGYSAGIVDRATAIPLNRLHEIDPTAFHLEPARPFRVRAVTSQGQPIASARVTLIDRLVDPRSLFMWGIHDAGWGDMIRAWSDNDGWAAFPRNPYQDATVLVQAPGYARRRLQWNGDSPDLTVQLEPEARIRGSARDTNGMPLKRFQVTVAFGTKEQCLFEVGPGQDGEFEIAELSAGVCTCFANADETNLGQSRLDLTAGQTSIANFTKKSP